MADVADATSSSRFFVPPKSPAKTSPWSVPEPTAWMATVRRRALLWMGRRCDEPPPRAMILRRRYRVSTLFHYLKPWVTQSLLDRREIICAIYEFCWRTEKLPPKFEIQQPRSNWVGLQKNRVTPSSITSTRSSTPAALASFFKSFNGSSMGSWDSRKLP